MKIYNPHDGSEFDIEDEMAEAMAAHSFTPWHAGGGCFAWRRDNAGGTYDLVSCANELDGLGSWGERYDELWLATRYDDACGEYIPVAENTDLLNAISLFKIFD